jgi:hypothetical protein
VSTAGVVLWATGKASLGLRTFTSEYPSLDLNAGVVEVGRAAGGRCVDRQTEEKCIAQRARAARVAGVGAGCWRSDPSCEERLWLRVCFVVVWEAAQVVAGTAEVGVSAARVSLRGGKALRSCRARLRSAGRGLVRNLLAECDVAFAL